MIQYGYPEEAAACYDRSISIEPGETLAYDRKADLLVNAGDRKGALECLRAGLAVEPKDQRCASLQDELRALFEEVKGGGQWPNVRSFSTIPYTIQWSARRRTRPRWYVKWLASLDRRDPVLPSRSGEAHVKPGRSPIRAG